MLRVFVCHSGTDNRREDIHLVRERVGNFSWATTELIIGSNMFRLLRRQRVGRDDLPSSACHGHAITTTLYLQ